MRRLPVSLLVLVLSFPLFAANVTVSCPGALGPGDFPSINAALATLDLTGPHSISVRGTCSEQVVLDGRDRLTISGGPGGPSIAGGSRAITVTGSRNIIIRNITLRASGSIVSIAEQSSVKLQGLLIESTSSGNGIGIEAFGGSRVALGDGSSTGFVTIRNARIGALLDGVDAVMNGFVTVENNAAEGVNVEFGRLVILGQRPATGGQPPQGGVNIIRNNGSHGVVAHGGANVDFSRDNLVQNNASNGVFVFDGGLAGLGGQQFPDGVKSGTIIENNGRGGLVALFNSQIRMAGWGVIRNNGGADPALQAGVTATHSSTIAISSAEITGTTGPGIIADSGSTVRLGFVSINGSSEEAVRVLHGSVLELLSGGNVIPANGGGKSIVCDGTAIVFGDLGGIAPFECDKATKK